MDMTTTTESPLTDPGPAIASERASEVDVAAAAPLDLAQGGHVRIRTASWAAPAITGSGVSYPPPAANAEERLQFYASTFPVVEGDATYYALPARAAAEL